MHLIILFLLLNTILYAQQDLIVETPTTKLISYELVTTHTQEQLKQKWKEQHIPQSVAPVRYSVEVYEIIYNTCWHDGTCIKASGLYYVPKAEGTKAEPLAMVCYHHGTQIKVERKVEFAGEQAICIGLAADGYLVARPDYIGLGKGEKKHLYHHVPTQTGASLDMLRAIKELNPQINVLQNEMLFVTGYSQGGHAAMGLHKMVQEKYSDEFKITASAPMSGAYDLVGVQEDAMFKEYSHPGYLPYLFFSFQEVYKLYEKESDVFQSPYDTILPTVFEGKHSMNYINRLIPKIPKDIIRPEVIERYVNDADFPFKKALRENSVHDWKPERPMLLCYCKADEQVDYRNALVADKKMKENGSKTVRVKHVNKHLNHGDCAMFAVMHVKLFFDSFRNGSKKGNMGAHSKRFLIGIGKSIVANRTLKRKKEMKKAEAKGEKMAERRNPNEVDD